MIADLEAVLNEGGVRGPGVVGPGGEPVIVGPPVLARARVMRRPASAVEIARRRALLEEVRPKAGPRNPKHVAPRGLSADIADRCDPCKKPLSAHIPMLRADMGDLEKVKHNEEEAAFVEKMIKLFLESDAPLMCSKTALFSLESIPRHKQAPLMIALAEALVSNEEWQRSTYERTITSMVPEESLFRYVDAARQDETSMNVGKKMKPKPKVALQPALPDVPHAQAVAVVEPCDCSCCSSWG